MKLTSQQLKVAELMASGLSQQKAATQIGVNPRTVRLWLANIPELRAEIDRLSKDAQSRSVAILSGLLTSAAVTLGELLKPEKPDSIRLAAARGVFADFVAMRQYVDLVAEINTIKAQLDAQKAKGGGQP
jgi:hypothetical protein